MTILSNNYLSGALFELSGTIANNATWSEDIYFFESGSGMDISGLDWKMTFRSDPTLTAADLTLSTDDGTLSIVSDTHSVASILRISVDVGSLSAYVGDYTADLASQDSNGVVILYAHGVVTFTLNPVSWS